MAKVAPGRSRTTHELAKAPTGIAGLDDVTMGGLPRGRASLVVGSAGSGKTLMAIEFLVRGAEDYREPGVFVAFEESADDLAKNVAALGFDLPAMQRRKQLLIEEIRVGPSEVTESGPFDLEPLFMRIGMAVDGLKAKRIVLDTTDVLFGGMINHGIVRSELARLFNWFKDRGLTTVITAEEGRGTLTRHGLEEYVADCVIVLDHRVTNQLSTRRLRIAKYRGSVHGTNEYPFLIDRDGLSVLPVSSLQLQYDVSSARLSSGIPRLDNMLGGGVYKGSCVMITGSAGMGKSILAATFADAACKRGRRALYISFEESDAQLIRNMRSVGLDLGRHVKSKRLKFMGSRPSLYGLEMHLVAMHKAIQDFNPALVVIDPVTDLETVGTPTEVRATLTRLMDHLRLRKITTLTTALRSDVGEVGSTQIGITSVIDTWIDLVSVGAGGERNRCISVVKARGSAHSNQMREFIINDEGVSIIDAYLGNGQVLTGSARISQVARERDEAEVVAQSARNRREELELKALMTAAQVKSLQAEGMSIKHELESLTGRNARANALVASDIASMTTMRGADLDHGARRDRHAANGRSR